MINEYEVFETTRFISSFHRARGSEEYKSLVHKIVEMLIQWGIDRKNIDVLEYPTGGVKYGNFESTMVWNVKDAELWLENPRIFINSFKACKTCVLFGSNSTNGWLSLNLVDENYQGDLSNKAILVSENPSKAFKKYVKTLGAKCLLVYYMRSQDESIGRTPEKMPNTVNYLSLPHTFEDSKYGAFGFSLTFNQFKLLKEFANKGYTVRMFIDSELKAGTLQILRVRFSKNTKKKIGIVAHLCHPNPGANDNASGSALALHLCKELNNLQLGVDVDVLLLPEFYGSLPYAAQNNYDCVINLDMVGEDQLKTGATLLLHETPFLLPGYYDELLYESLMMYAPISSESYNKRFFRIKFKSGSDHVVFENFGAPSPFIGQWPDRYYHTSEDTPDKCDPSMFKWIGEAVLRTLKLSHDIPKHIKELSDSKVRAFLLNVENRPGAGLIKAVIERKNHISLIEPKKKIQPAKEGPLGYEWLDKIGDLSDKRYIIDLGEILNLGARYLNDYDACVTFASSYLCVDEKEVADVLDLLIKNDFIKT
ncbi:MAG TPA: DUF4910 domain-containing protein [Pseudothermotoga sp.]